MLKKVNVKKNYRPISRILSAAIARNSSAIYLDQSSLTGSVLPTPLDAIPYETAACEQHTPDNPERSSDPRCTWHFNPQGLSAPTVADQRRALLPHIFTLTLFQSIYTDCIRAVIFCDTCYACLFSPEGDTKQTPPVRWCGALCCPDFPPRFSQNWKMQRRQSGL